MKRLTFLLLFLLPAVAFCQTIQPSLDIRMTANPVAVPVGSKLLLSYELMFSNFSTKDLTIVEIAVRNGSDSATVKKFDGNEMTNYFYKPGAATTTDNLNPATFLIFYADFEIPKEKLPATIFHEVIIRNEVGIVSKLKGANSVVSGKCDVLGPPLLGGPWAAVFSKAWPRGHRRVIFTVDGQARIPGRFAIDFIKLDEHGKFAGGDNDRISNWYGYSADVLAVADGTIASTRDDFKESPTLSGHPAYEAAKATGNYISLTLPSGNFAFYEHLKPASILVKPGQRVKKGDVIAKLGFTGQSTGPHLHFHIANSDSPLGAEGLPFVFEKFKLIGTYPDFNAFGKEPWSVSNLEFEKKSPQSNSVISFPLQK